MKPIVRRGLGLLLVAGLLAIWAVSASMAKQSRRIHTCTGKQSLEVIVTDSLERRFVAREDVEKWLDSEYRAWAGLPLDSVDLYRIENIIGSHSAVKACEAWLTDNGALHIQLSQRQPVVRFQDGTNGYYADAGAFIFPLQARGSVQVPIVDGKIPLKVGRGFKGEITDPAQKAWLEKIIGMINFMNGTVWMDNISQISSDSSGDLTLYPREGRETFIFGRPERVEEKFALIGKYYESIEPSKEKGYYKTVDVRYRGEIVCRK